MNNTEIKARLRSQVNNGRIWLDNEFVLITQDKCGKIYRVDKVLHTVNELTQKELNTLLNIR